MKNKRFLYMKLLILISAMLLGDLSYANESEEAKENEAIYIIARKRKENLQEVPISITTFNEYQLEEAGINTVRDLTDTTPNVSLIGSTSGRYSTPYIRGQGNQDLNLPEEISVGFNLDEVPLPRYAMDNDLVDIQSVEVLRGPQGTLFGKNTQAGAINIYTKEPNYKDGSKITLEAGNLDTKAFVGTTNFRLGSEKLQNRLSVKLKEQGGFIKDTYLNKDLGDSETYSFNNTLVYRPTNTFKSTFKIGAQNKEGSDALIISRNEPGYPKSHQNIDPIYKSNLITTSLKLEKDFDDVLLTIIGAFNYYDFNIKYDEADYYITYDYLRSQVGQALADQYINDSNELFRSIQEYQRQYYTEFRISNKDSSDISWTTGLNISRNHYRLLSHIRTFSGGFVFKKQNINLITDSFSVFGEATKKLTETYSLTFGTRVNHDIKEFKSIHNSTAIADYRQNSEEDFTNFTSKLTLAAKLSETKNLYASVARGYQSGGYPSYHFNNYNGISKDQPAYEDSTSLSYEIGSKMSFFNRKLTLNSAIFFNDIKDKQVRVKDTSTNQSFYANIDTDVYGAELEAKLKATTDLTFGSTLGYTNSKFKEETVSGTSNTVLNKKGARLANIPYWTGSTFAQYSYFLNSVNGFLNFRTSYKYVGHRFGDNINHTRMGSYGLVGARVSFEKESYTITTYVNNLFDKLYESQAYYYSAFDKEVSSPGQPRTYGVKATYRF
ncbi:putative TonB-dependent outer membrane receptor [Halobacteriovorax marinus SJ]|uniref:TonB-dependent outer membrane receptor n=2 Tax=Halobacteriovorax marinus TaxID=97084 RepID=E1X4K5_HALMS|nr:putative TonB-dependent outer membrane receptor [Halobacteriovorax marinus SJ]